MTQRTRLLFYLSCLLTVALTSAPGQSPSPATSAAPKVEPAAAPDAVELTRLLREFLEGASRNDLAAHNRFWADDLIYTSSSGRRLGKAEIIAEVSKEGPPKPGDETTVFTAEDVRIQQYD